MGLDSAQVAVAIAANGAVAQFVANQILSSVSNADMSGATPDGTLAQQLLSQGFPQSGNVWQLSQWINNPANAALYNKWRAAYNLRRSHCPRPFGITAP